MFWSSRLHGKKGVHKPHSRLWSEKTKNKQRHGERKAITKWMENKANDEIHTFSLKAHMWSTRTHYSTMIMIRMAWPMTMTMAMVMLAELIILWWCSDVQVQLSTQLTKMYFVVWYFCCKYAAHTHTHTEHFPLTVSRTGGFGYFVCWPAAVSAKIWL